MKIHISLISNFPNPAISNLLCIALILFHLSPSFCQDALDEFKACGVVYNCGDLINISYPFWGNERREICGRREFELKCEENETTTIEINSLEYNVLKINQSDHRMTIARSDLFKDYCPQKNLSTASLDYRLFRYSSNDLNITVYYDCDRHQDNPEIRDFKCEFNARNSDRANYFIEEPTPTNLTPMITGCRMFIRVTVTVEGLEGRIENGTAALEKALRQGFDVGYGDWGSMACNECNKTGGRCAANGTYPFYCICENGDVHPYLCITPLPPPGKPRGLLKKLLVAMASASIIMIIMIIIFVYYIKKRISSEEEIEEIIKSYATQTPKRYSYSKVKKITKSFNNKLGQGGFSIVYKGKLPDGREVAVKLLNESREYGHDFINEVVSISRTSHVNIVTLLGFCYEQNKRVLIYEYMPKGSLDKYIFQHGLLTNDVRLDWSTLYGIVIGIARGLEYLHRGCNTRILHFDIKPHNILLDNDFCPKIADFGLAKQCKAKESHVSMTGAKGTAGFMAPEVIFRAFGKVSHKSDVYSYGMLILEMVGERKNPNQGMSQSSEEYFPDWIYKDLTESKDIGGNYYWGNTGEEEEVAKKMIIVGLCCIQTLPNDRPSMSDVVAMLEGSVGCLQIPPKPALFAPPPELYQASSSAS